MSIKQEISLGVITFASTIISPDIVLDFAVGIGVYTSSRLFYHYFGAKITIFIDKLKKKMRLK